MAERYMPFKCQQCGAEVTVYEHTSRLTCGDCKTEMTVERRHGTIALKVLCGTAHTIRSEEPAAEIRSTAQLTAQLNALKSESSRVLRRQVTAGIVGGICGIIFGYVGVSSLLGKDLSISVTMLLCAGGSFWFVRFVMRDSNAAGDAIAKKVKEIEVEIAETQHLNDQRLLAAKLGLDRIALELYLTEVVYYPSWIQHSRARVPMQVSQAIKTGVDAVLLKTSRTEYLFEWNCNHMDDGQDRGELTVSVNGCIVFRVRGLVARDQWLTSASSYSVMTLVEGSWVEELLAIWAESKEVRLRKLP